MIHLCTEFILSWERNLDGNVIASWSLIPHINRSNRSFSVPYNVLFFFHFYLMLHRPNRSERTQPYDGDGMQWLDAKQWTSLFSAFGGNDLQISRELLRSFSILHLSISSLFLLYFSCLWAKSLFIVWWCQRSRNDFRKSYFVWMEMFQLAVTFIHIRHRYFCEIYSLSCAARRRLV